MYKLTKYIVPILFLIALFSSCRKELILDESKGAKLQFSIDTLIFDTVFTSVGSTTRRFKVYNPNKNAVKISSITLGKGSSSPFRINVDGISSYPITDLEIAGEDSLFVFAEVTIDPNSTLTPFVVTDSILFITNGNKQDVELVAWGQNAHFFNADTVSCNAVWTNDLPYVIYNSVLIDKNCKLTIQKGCRIYSHKNSRIFVLGTLDVQGELGDSVLFQTDRLEKYLDDEPGQWGGIHFLIGSTGSKINYALIKNAVVGLRVDSLPVDGSSINVEIFNTVFKYHTVAGILGFTAGVRVFNSLFYACNQFAVAGLLGGIYDFRHNTIANYNNVFGSSNPVVALTDNFDTGDELLVADLTANFQNNIIYGPQDDEIIFNNDGGGTLSLNFENNLVKSKDISFNGTSNIVNKDPKFINISKENFHLDTLSPAAFAAKDIRSSSIILQKDLDGVTRSATSSIGCYERVQ